MKHSKKPMTKHCFLKASSPTQAITAIASIKYDSVTNIAKVQGFMLKYIWFG